jgi:two-component system cell cycle sensor histidine kinase/response regulator CckA
LSGGNNTLDTSVHGSIVDGAVRDALRLFSGRIAHDFNNMLTMLMAYPQLIRRDLPENSQGHELLSVMESNAELMADISARLSKFAAVMNMSTEPISMDETVANTIADMIEDGISDGIEVVTQLNSNCKISVPRSTLGLLVNELFANACENLHGHGKITVETDMFTPKTPIPCQGGTVPVAEYARIRISDNGKGVSSEDINKLVEPFFSINKTTKARGSGLGLSIVFAALSDCGGYLVLESEERGFCASALFRCGNAKEEVPDKGKDLEGKSSAQVSSDKYRVLVVDDEEDIVSLFKLMLGEEIRNISIDIARNGLDAIDKFKKGHHDVIVMDLHMPIMDGHEAFTKLEKMCRTENIRMPGMVFCTGYIPPDGIRQAVERNQRAYTLLQKPVSIRSLVSAVKTRLPAA